MDSSHQSLQSIAAKPPTIDVVRIASAVREQFGLHGEMQILVSERDLNFRLQASNGQSYVVRIASLAEDRTVSDFQIAALQHLEGAGVEGVPRVVRTLSGSEYGSIEDNNNYAHLRLVTWLDGHLLSDVDVTPDIATDFGRRLAVMDKALADFSHPADEQVLLWDTQRALELRALLVHVADPDMQRLLNEVLDTYRDRVEPTLSTLPRQVIHNDANRDNVLVDESGRVTGIIDFGDMLRAPRVVDVSTAAAYLRTTRSDALYLIAPFVNGYREHNSLTQAELDLLYDLIRTRLAMTLTILFWRVSARDKGDSYREKSLQSEASAFTFLRHLTALGRREFQNRFRAI